MVDTTGLMGTSCDCPDRGLSSRCIHVHLLEKYHSQFNEPVLDGEEPTAFLVNLNYDDLRYLYSVASASGSECNRSHKRMVITCSFSYIWRCRSCPRLSYSTLE